jgi:hypothetical protein
VPPPRVGQHVRRAADDAKVDGEGEQPQAVIPRDRS